MSDINAVTWDDAVAVTPNDTDTPNMYARPAAGLNVAASGTVMVRTARGTKTQVYVAAGEQFYLAFTHVYATGTSATGIVAGIVEPYGGAKNT